ncbi:MAG: phosphate ABC transporter permease PstA [Clostridia bacterium]|nr:phosphate ABC transporter permease PstA [Clostridia bacterium]
MSRNTPEYIRKRAGEGAAPRKGIRAVGFLGRLPAYRKHPASLAAALATHLGAAVTVLVLGFLIVYILAKGIPNLKPEMFSPTYTSDNQSMLPAILNTCTMTLLSLLAAVPFGIGSAVYLAEYAPKGSGLVRLVRMTTETLQGIPSIVYGLFGKLLFSDALHFGYSMLSGGLTMAIMILPLIMRTTEEALLCVPDMYREGSFGLGAGRLRTVMRIVLPTAVPGILSGIILAIGRIVGETAALMYTSGTVAQAAGLFDSGSTLALHMYKQASEGLYTRQAYATSVVLLALVLVINFVSGRIARWITKGRQTHDQQV